MYDFWYGYSSTGKSQELATVDEVVEFICTEGLQGDLMITDAMDTAVCTTFGIYLNQCNPKFRSKIIDKLIARQTAMGM